MSYRKPGQMSERRGKYRVTATLKGELFPEYAVTSTSSLKLAMKEMEKQLQKPNIDRSCLYELMKGKVRQITCMSKRPDK